MSAACLWLLLHLGVAGAVEVLNISAFGAKPDGSYTTPCVRAALEQVRQGKADRLVFPPGRYDFWPDHAEEEYLFISNNDEGLKRIAFMITGVKRLEIDGGGATVVFHGRMMPFLIENAHGVTLKNFSVDYRRPFQSEGRVLAVTPDSVDLEFSAEFPYAIRNGVLVFTDGQKSSGPQTTVTSGEVLYDYGSLLAFDPEKRETAFMAKDLYGLGTGPHFTFAGILLAHTGVYASGTRACLPRWHEPIFHAAWKQGLSCRMNTSLSWVRSPICWLTDLRLRGLELGAEGG